MKAMILAAGRGDRMRPLTDTTPKPLLMAGGRSLIEQTIAQLVHADITEIVINIAYLGVKIKQFLGNGHALGVSIEYSDEGETGLETAGGIIKALPLLGEQPFLVVNGDIAHNYDFSHLVHRSIHQAHLVLIPNPAHHPEGDFYLSPTGLAQAGLAQVEGQPRFTFSGIGLYHADLFKHHTISKLKLAPLLRQAMQQNNVTAELFTDFWMDIGTTQRLEALNQYYSKAIL